MYTKVLVAAQQNLLRQLGPLAREAGFYLGGGTAVAIQLGHRRSLDLGWFTGQPIGDPAALAARLRDRGLDITIRGVAAGTLHASRRAWS
ncbi:MAG: hypothetical protein HY703_11870 [Gemmatimonadetes bacterium]|nr:hypothetical protein [Gemmatimonadota bacterium]